MEGGGVENKICNEVSTEIHIYIVGESHNRICHSPDQYTQRARASASVEQGCRLVGRA
jgi:hypothetical protein